jgi:heme exporter protein A
MDTANKLIVTNLSCVRQLTPLFNHLSFTLSSGEMLLIEGPNGSGKSSLLRLLTGLSTPAGGEITWQQTSIQHLAAHYWQALHYIGHSNGIKLGLTVSENLHLAGCLANHVIADEEPVLQALQLHAHKNTEASFLSAGQKRRLALAKLFLFPKPLWILDEPLTALDATTQAFFLSQLELHLQKGSIAIMTSHQPIALINRSQQTLRLGVC